MDTIIILGQTYGFDFLGTNFPKYSLENACMFERKLTEVVESGLTHDFHNQDYKRLQQDMRKDLIKVIRGSDYGRTSFIEKFEKCPEWHMAYFIPDLLEMEDPTKGGPNLCTHIRGMGDCIVLSFLRRALDAEPEVSSREFGIKKEEAVLPEYMMHPKYNILVPTSSIPLPLHVITDEHGRRKEYYGRPGEQPSEGTIMACKK